MKTTVLSLAALSALSTFSAEWKSSEWISVKEAPVYDGSGSERAADGTSWFAKTFVNPKAVVSATWRVTGLGVFDVYVNGQRIGRTGMGDTQVPKAPP